MESRRVQKKGPGEYRETWNLGEYRRRVDPGEYQRRVRASTEKVEFERVPKKGGSRRVSE